MSDAAVLSVADFIAHINRALSDMWDMSVAVEGEVSGYRVSNGQWVGFDLKDGNALVNVFMPVWQLRIPVEDGMRVRVYGTPRVYPKYGKFSMSAERVLPVGEGALKKALQALRARLDAEGLFDPSRKRVLPRFPNRIAFVGSKDSAAYGDFIRILSERWGGVAIDVYHVLVQGDRAPAQIVAAFREAQAGRYDVVVMTRGGGSLEDLMAFNDEAVVRAVHASKIPTLVAIGHERDVTLAEEAADVRASTPTDCARRLVPDRRDVIYELGVVEEAVRRAMSLRIESGYGLLSRAVNAPALWIRTHAAGVEHLSSRCAAACDRWFSARTERLLALERVLASCDPNAVLKRGYAVIRDETGKGVVSVRDLRLLQQVTIRLSDGNADASVTKIKPNT